MAATESRATAGKPKGYQGDLQAVPCNLCGSTSSSVVLDANTTDGDLRPEAFACTSPHVGKHGRIVACDECGLIFASPRPTPELIQSVYGAVEDNAYLEHEQARIATFTHSVRGVKRLRRRGRLLDIGAHVGTFLHVAREHGYEVSGVEPSSWAAEHARRVRGLDVRTGGIEEAGLEPESFDVVTVWDVIEHVTDPLALLRQIHEVLRPNGLVAITTMDVGALAPRLLRGLWPWYMLMHLYYFTPKTLSRMLEKAGFEVIEVGPHIRITHVRYVISKLEAYSPSVYRLARMLTEALHLGGVRVPINFGDLMTVYARKV